MTAHVLFIQGGGKGAHAEDAALAASLQEALGAGYAVAFPRMPAEADPDMATWKQTIASALSRLSGAVMLVGHSIGGSILLNFLSEGRFDASIAAVFLLAAPSRDQGDWNFDDLELPRDIGTTLGTIPHVGFYHCRDDDTVPFAHLSLHAARMPRAIIRAFDHGGHQFGEDLAFLARDIRAIVAG